MSGQSRQGTTTVVQNITQPERGRTVGTRVRTTITPGEVIEIDDAELVDLERQGLIESREGDDGFVDAEPVEVESGVITDPPEADPSKDVEAKKNAEPSTGKGKGKAE